MEIKQISTILNTIYSEATGEAVAIVQEDLSNIVDVGGDFEDKVGTETLLEKIVDKVGKTIFTSRKYGGQLLSIQKSDWEFGAMLEKISVDLPEAVDNKSWALQSGQSVDPFVVTLPSVNVKYYNKKETFEIDITILDVQLKGAFTSADKMNAFFEMVYTSIENAMTLAVENLSKRAVNNMIAETIYDEVSTHVIDKNETNVRAVNLLYEYNDRFNANLSKDEALITPSFIRYAVKRINDYQSYLRSMTQKFNGGGKTRFTPLDKQHLVVLSEFDSSITSYMQSDTYNKELVALKEHETIDAWQYVGDFEFEDLSALKVKCASNSSHTLDGYGVLAVLFDDEAVAVNQTNKRTTSQYNARGEYTNLFYKYDVSYINDLAENFVVFYVGKEVQA